jgi:hypothetical protein
MAGPSCIGLAGHASFRDMLIAEPERLFAQPRAMPKF